MPSFDSLPADQRAVLELVLQRGRTYDEIARMLAIDRAGVRQRALAAFDALGPQTRVEPLRRALITDYLLGQLPPRVSDETRDKLGRSPSERAWARVLASELAPLARDPLPEIPVHDATDDEPAASGAGRATATRSSRAGATRSSRAAAAEPKAADGDGAPEGEKPAPRRSSRLGGAVLLGLALVALVVVVVLLATGGSAKKHTSTKPVSTNPSSTASSSTATRVIAQVNLLPPNGTGPAKGIAQVVTANNSTGIAIYATGVPPNNHNAYAVWLYNSATSAKLLGFVSPGVGANGQLQTEGPLPSDASTFKQLLVTLETQQHPTTPGQIVLQGTLNLP